jgi:hypothetical protein
LFKTRNCWELQFHRCIIIPITNSCNVTLNMQKRKINYLWTFWLRSKTPMWIGVVMSSSPIVCMVLLQEDYMFKGWALQDWKFARHSFVAHLLFKTWNCRELLCKYIETFVASFCNVMLSMKEGNKSWVTSYLLTFWLGFSKRLSRPVKAFFF